MEAWYLLLYLRLFSFCSETFTNGRWSKTPIDPIAKCPKGH